MKLKKELPSHWKPSNLNMYIMQKNPQAPYVGSDIVQHGNMYRLNWLLFAVIGCVKSDWFKKPVSWGVDSKSIPEACKEWSRLDSIDDLYLDEHEKKQVLKWYPRALTFMQVMHFDEVKPDPETKPEPGKDQIEIDPKPEPEKEVPPENKFKSILKTVASVMGALAFVKVFLPDEIDAIYDSILAAIKAILETL